MEQQKLLWGSKKQLQPWFQYGHRPWWVKFFTLKKLISRSSINLLKHGIYMPLGLSLIVLRVILQMGPSGQHLLPFYENALTVKVTHESAFPLTQVERRSSYRAISWVTDFFLLIMNFGSFPVSKMCPHFKQRKFIRIIDQRLNFVQKIRTHQVYLHDAH